MNRAHSTSLATMSMSLALLLALSPAHEARAQGSTVPPDMQRLLLFTPEAGKVRVISGQDMRMLQYERDALRKVAGYCNNVGNVTSSVSITDFGKNAGSAHDMFTTYTNERRGTKGLKSEVPFDAAEEGVVFEFDYRNRDGKFLCGNYERETFFRVGGWLVRTSEGFWNETPIEAPSLAPKLASLLKGEQPLTPGEVAFRNVLFGGLGFAGNESRACLDEVMSAAESQAGKDKKMADEIAKLRDAAARVHAIQVLASVPVGPDNFADFDPKWWDALKEVVPNPTSTPDPEDSAIDRLVDLLPPPFSTVVNIARTGNKTMRAIKTHIVDPAAHGEIYACYRRQRELEGSERIIDNLGQAALEDAAAQVLLDATAAGCKYANNFANSYERELGNRTGEARADEYKRLIRPVAVRFEFIYRVEDAKARQEALIAERWKPVQDILNRVKTRVNSCLADRTSRSR